MADKKRLIWDEDAQHRLVTLAVKRGNDAIPMDMITNILFNESSAVDAEEVVRCKNCEYGVFDEEKGVWKCVESAEWDEGMGDWFGFVVYHPNDFYCANGERRNNEN